MKSWSTLLVLMICGTAALGQPASYRNGGDYGLCEGGWAESERECNRRKREKGRAFHDCLLDRA
jgi:hypothetical protein